MIKILLALQHRKLPPTINFERLNEHIDLADSPFYVNTRLQEWELRHAPRRQAAISSFGFSGTNAHLVIGEHPQTFEVNRGQGDTIIPLSARTAEQLHEKASHLLTFVRSRSASVDLADIAYTLQVGRVPMDERLGFVVSSAEQLAEKLEAYVGGGLEAKNFHRGQVKRGGNESLSSIAQDDDVRETINDKWVARKKLAKLVDLWVKGWEVDWNRHHGEPKPRRISLPVYPFARERYWIEGAAAATALPGAATRVLHPLLHGNTSDLTQQSYRSTFTGIEFFLSDHQVRVDGGSVHKVLPGAAYLEMARAAIERALPARAESAVMELRNTVWLQPIAVSGNTQVTIALVANDHDTIDYEIYTEGEDEEIIHCQGRAVLGLRPAPAALDLAQLREEMGRGAIDPGSIYPAFARMGLVYGPGFQAVTAIDRGSGQAFARLRLPHAVEETLGDYVLHPSLLDSAIQAAVGLIDGPLDDLHEPRLPFALDSLQVFSRCAADMIAWVRYVPGTRPTDSVLRLDIDLCDERGSVCVQMRGLSLRVLSQQVRAGATQSRTTGTLLAAPVWQTGVVETSGHVEYAEHHVVLCEPPTSDAEQLTSLLPQCQCVSLQAHPQRTIADRFSEYALACFERIETILQSKPRGKVLFQIVVAGEREQLLFAGLSALLQTAAQENPQFIGQLIMTSPALTVEDLAQALRKEKTHALDTLIRYEDGVRQVLRWQEVSADAETLPVVFRSDGVYLITGGLGALGVLFAREILSRTNDARVILTGRSALTEALRSRSSELSAPPGRVSYRQVDLNEPPDVEQVIAGIRDEYGRLDGVLHCAGMIADNFILKKPHVEFREVLAPKVTGTVNLDLATRDLSLDFFVLFSSIAGAKGNLGQADYAAANAFMDQFAAYRNRQVAEGLRSGRTRSINWALWQAGTMSPDQSSLELVRKATGITAMQTVTGMAAFYRSLTLPHDQLLVAEGELTQMRRFLLGTPAVPELEIEYPSAALAEVPPDEFAQKTQDHLLLEFSGVLKLPARKIDPQAPLETYGIDSILAMELTSLLERTFGPLPKTLFFEYQTIRELAGYFVQSHSARLGSLFAAPDSGKWQGRPRNADSRAPGPAARGPVSIRRRGVLRISSASQVESDPIAIIGLSGRYPEAIDLEAYWRNLRDGRDCIIEVPKERWDWREYFSEDRTEGGHHYSKWGGFIAGVDEFDPLFFNISPKEAKYLDPQERLFLQHAWMAIEDAGYTRARLQMPTEGDLPGQVGVYAGVMYSEYQLFGAEASAQGKRVGVPGSAASIANRVSYALNLHGPSMTL
ncbi:MAG TPA: SDR family NAD(P)-dependent oxidoreductase, partial [Thermoanaerobaculia bacterium]|nr:SDR family NAD(P)-dependent oxidoreductase [Thermoanaerobaculia bacterium]